MKDLMTFLAAILGFFSCYALTASLLAATFCLKYVDVVQCPAFILFGGILSFVAASAAGFAVQKAEL